MTLRSSELESLSIENVVEQASTVRYSSRYSEQLLALLDKLAEQNLQDQPEEVPDLRTESLTQVDPDVISFIKEMGEGNDVDPKEAAALLLALASMPSPKDQRRAVAEHYDL